MTRIAALTAVAVLCGACTSGNADPAASPSPLTFGPPSFPPTASPTPDDPYAIPDEIDAAYVEKVYGALAEVESEAATLLREAYGDEEVLPPEIRDRLRAINGPEWFPEIAARWQLHLTGEEPPPIPADNEPVTIEVVEVVSASGSCIVARARFDFSGSAATPPPIRPEQYLALIRTDSSRDPKNFNPTPWVIAYEMTVESGIPDPESPCAS